MIFHFSVHTPTHVFLTEVVELASLEDARLEAARRPGDLLREHATVLWVDKDWHMDVTDADGLVLFVIYISAMKATVTADDPRLNSN